MEYKLLPDDNGEDEPEPGEKSGCGCLPMMLIGLPIIVLIAALGNR